MKEIIIWHNPKCGKSRDTLKILEEHKFNITVRDYQLNPPSEKELKEILKLLKLSIKDIIRTKEELFLNLKLSLDLPETTLFKTLVANPKLIERPIVINGDKAIIARPAEKVLSIL